MLLANPERSICKELEIIFNCAAAGDETARSKSTVDAPITLFSELKNLKLVAEDAGAENIPAYPQTQANDTCTLLFSSGTTGLSKAVQLTHANFISAITAYNTLEPGQSTMETDVCLAIIPMFHVYGLGIVMLATLERGASVVIMPRYSLPQMLGYIEKYRITVATIVPPIIVSLVKSAEVAKYDLSSLRIIATGWKSFTLSLSTILNQYLGNQPNCFVQNFASMRHLFSFGTVTRFLLDALQSEKKNMEVTIFRHTPFLEVNLSCYTCSFSARRMRAKLDWFSTSEVFIRIRCQQ